MAPNPTTNNGGACEHHLPAPPAPGARCAQRPLLTRLQELVLRLLASILFILADRLSASATTLSLLAAWCVDEERPSAPRAPSRPSARGQKLVRKSPATPSPARRTISFEERRPTSPPRVASGDDIVGALRRAAGPRPSSDDGGAVSSDYTIAARLAPCATGPPPASSAAPLIEALWVDDDVVQLMISTRHLGKLNVRVTCVPSAEDALAVLAERHAMGTAFPDIVYMDLNLPGMDGRECVAEIRRLYPKVAMPVTLVSDFDLETVNSLASEEGFSEYLFKPLTLPQVAASLQNQLSIRRLQQREQVLSSILPTSVIDLVQPGAGEMISESLDKVSILFTDIVDYTPHSSRISTLELMQVLHNMFLRFDQLSTKYGCYKVETIGDAYMVASGLTAESRDSQAQRLLNMAADMLETCRDLEWPNGDPVQIRVGVHTGPAYAGVVGAKNPRYGLFGDTVNTASRMESTSYGGCVQISHETFAQYQSERTASASRASEVCGTPPHSFIPLGERNIKGKGAMRTWLLKAGEDWAHALLAKACVSLPGLKSSGLLASAEQQQPGKYKCVLCHSEASGASRIAHSWSIA